jgi:hypothetical protein
MQHNYVLRMMCTMQYDKSKAGSFKFRVDPDLKTAFVAAADAADRPAAQILREFMRAYVRHREQRAFDSEARRQSRIIAEAAADPYSDEAAVMRGLEAALDAEDGGEWR